MIAEAGRAERAAGELDGEVKGLAQSRGIIFRETTHLEEVALDLANNGDVQAALARVESSAARHRERLREIDVALETVRAVRKLKKPDDETAETLPSVAPLPGFQRPI